MVGSVPDGLDPSDEADFRSVFPVGTTIVHSQSYRPGYQRYPMCVHLKSPAGVVQRCVVKVKPPDLIERVIQTLNILAALGLAVPEVRSGPLPLLAENLAMVVLSELPGRCLPWCGISSLAEADATCLLLLEGIASLHGLTDQVREFDGASALPRYTLQSEFADTIVAAGDWNDDAVFRQAVDIAREALAGAETPLVFSNGDYNPQNFIYDGQALTGFVDFEGACLIREVSVRGQNDRVARAHIFQLLEESSQIITKE